MNIDSESGLNETWASIGAGVNHTVALNENGNLYSWGLGQQG